MELRDILWPWGAVAREREVIAQCANLRREVSRRLADYAQLADQYEALARENNKLVGRVLSYEASLRTALIRDPKTGRMMKRVK